MDTEKSLYFEQQLLSAMETIAQGIVSKLEFDKTILCTIEDDSEREDGKYIVSDGSSTFEAYTEETDYKKGMTVYVLIPQGNYSKQKTIVSRYLEESAAAINYISPLNKIIGIKTIKFGSKDEVGLLANGDIKRVNLEEVSSKEEDSEQEENPNVYNCVGVRANFRTDLPDYLFTNGNYGLRFILSSGEKQETLEFSAEDMFGNPYKYVFETSQEVVFDISKLGFQPTEIQAYFFQDGNFKYKQETDGGIVLLPTTVDLGEDKVELNNNLFVSDIEVVFGYALEGITEETIRLYTPNDLSFSSKKGNNTKTILVKYFQPQTDGTFNIIDSNDKEEQNVKIHWYRYVMDNDVEDELAGVFWKEITEVDGDKIVNNYNIEFTPNTSLSREKIKVIYEIIEEEETETQDNSEEEETAGEDQKVTTISRYLESNELVFENAEAAALNLHDLDLIRELQLSCGDNSNGVYKVYSGIDNKINNYGNTTDRILYANFDLYTSVDLPEEEIETNKVTWYLPKDNTMIDPVDFAMPATFEFSDTTETEDDTSEEEAAATKKHITYLPEDIVWTESGDYYTCTYNWKYSNEGEDGSVSILSALPMHYSIKEYYASGYNNNTIKCEIERYGKVYEAEIDLIFGEEGTNGTHYTLNVRLGKSYNCNVAYDNENKKYKINDLDSTSVSRTAKPFITADNSRVTELIAELYNEFGELVEGVSFGYGWKNNNINLQIAYDKDDKPYIWYESNSLSDKTYGIVEVTASTYINDDLTKLCGYLPLGVAAAGVVSYQGATKIIYDAQGINPRYQTEHYIKDCDRWEVDLLSDTEKISVNALPKFSINSDGKYQLKADNMFLTNLESEQIVVRAYSENTLKFQQSLLYIQNRFGNQMLNDWDGELTINESENYILSALMGAGAKNSDNSFSGVLMGKVGTSTANQTGIFGYDEGVQTFSVDVEGKATLGASGKGQIKFSGTEGTIESASGNTKFDLTNGSIYLSSSIEEFTTTEKRDEKDYPPAEVKINSTDNRGTYFSITPIKYNEKSKTINGTTYYTYTKSTIGNNPLLEIGYNNYYLQSANYKDPTRTYNDDGSYTENLGTGVKFNLNDGKLTGYDFKLQAGQKISTGDYRLIIDSDSSTDDDGNYNYKPLTIGSNFSVSWDGKVIAVNGDFSGKITADSGTIGGWTINSDSLSKGYSITSSTTSLTAVDGSAIIISGGVKIDDYEDIVLNIGTKFFVDKDGNLYATSAILDGYATSNKLNDINNALTASISSTQSEVTGAISNIGTIGSKAVFLSQNYSNFGKILEQGYYDEEEGKFYKATKSYAEADVMVCQTGYHYYDYLTDKYYQKTADGFTESSSTSVSAAGKGYYNNGKFYYKQTYVKGDEVTSGDSTTIYFDVDTGLTYKWSSGKFVQTTEEDDVTFFSVDAEGLLKAKNAVIAGTIYAHQGQFTGKVIAREGEIGGWTINSNSLSKGYGITSSLKACDGSAIIVPDGITMTDSNNTRDSIVLNIGTNFFVDKYGQLYSSAGDFSGKITATSGTIGGWTIDGNELIGITNNETISVRLTPTTTDIEGNQTVKVGLVYNDTDNQNNEGEEIVSTVSYEITPEKTWGDFIKDNANQYNKMTPMQKAINQIVFLVAKASLAYADRTFSILKKQEVDQAYQYQCIFSISNSGRIYWRKDFNAKSNFDEYSLGMTQLTDQNEKNYFGLTTKDRSYYLCDDDYLYLPNFKTQIGTLNDQDNEGGLQLNGEETTKRFWNNSLFTRTCIENSDTNQYDHYVGFLRGFGSTSKASTNVFLGSKIYSASKQTSQVAWTSAIYNFYIKFNGDARFQNLKAEQVEIPNVGGYETIITNGKIQLAANSLGSSVLTSSDADDAFLYLTTKTTNNNTPIFAINAGSITYSTTITRDYSWMLSTDNTSKGVFQYCVSFVNTTSAEKNHPPRQALVYSIKPETYNSANTDAIKFYVKSGVFGAATSSSMQKNANSFLGTSTYPWAYIYGTTSTTATSLTETEANLSDGRLKDIQSDDCLTSALQIYDNLKTVAYKYKNFAEADNHSRTHIGFIAQEVEEAITAAGLTSEDFAAVQIVDLDEPKPGCEDEKRYYLNYNEFHGLHVLKNQEQDKRITALEQRVAELEEKLREKGVLI